MPFYRTKDGQGSMHVNFGRNAGPVPCQAKPLAGDNPTIASHCLRISRKLCDAPAGQDLAGNLLTCDMPICDKHATRGGPNIDYCPRHAHLARSADDQDARRI